MISRSRVWLIFMITLAIILAQANLASSQTVTSRISQQWKNWEQQHAGDAND
jgi:hypothetical protein